MFVTASVIIIANDRVQISQAHVQDGLSCECRELRVLKHFVDVHNYIVLAFVFCFCMLYMCLYCALHIWRIVRYLDFYIKI